MSALTYLNPPKGFNPTPALWLLSEEFRLLTDAGLVCFFFKIIFPGTQSRQWALCRSRAAAAGGWIIDVLAAAGCGCHRLWQEQGRASRGCSGYHREPRSAPRACSNPGIAVSPGGSQRPASSSVSSASPSEIGMCSFCSFFPFGVTYFLPFRAFFTFLLNSGKCVSSTCRTGTLNHKVIKLWASPLKWSAGV